jgi:mannose-6-phosphate isomerase
MEHAYPLRFREILRSYGFGERWIAEAFEKPGLPPEGRIAETWEVCDRPGESSVVVNGPLAGRTLGELIAAEPEGMLGEEIVRRFGPRFPLLIKLLDATNPLGEQCHPNDNQVARWGAEDFSGKTEAWYLLRARPSARVFAGNADGVTVEQIRQALESGTARDLMVDRPAIPGDAYLLYAGTMHYTPGGLLFYEIMQNSDFTIGLGPRLASLPTEEREGRVSRALEAVHLEEGSDPRTRPVTVCREGGTRTFILACEEFALERIDIEEPCSLDPARSAAGEGAHFCVLTCIEGASDVISSGHEEPLAAGQTCMLPAVLGPVSLRPRGPASLLRAYVPDLIRDVITPLREAGIEDEAIRALGGNTELNPLWRLL